MDYTASDLALGLLEERTDDSQVDPLTYLLSAGVVVRDMSVDDWVPSDMRIQPVAVITRTARQVGLSIDRNCDIDELRFAVATCLGRFLVPEDEEDFVFEVFPTFTAQEESFENVHDVLMSSGAGDFAMHLLLPTEDLVEISLSSYLDTDHLVAKYGVPRSVALRRIETFGDRR